MALLAEAATDSEHKTKRERDSVVTEGREEDSEDRNGNQQQLLLNVQTNK